MREWILIVFAHVGAMGDGNSNALDHVTGLATVEDCRRLGKSWQDLANGSVKRIEYKCVEVTRKTP